MTFNYSKWIGQIKEADSRLSGNRILRYYRDWHWGRGMKSDPMNHLCVCFLCCLGRLHHFFSQFRGSLLYPEQPGLTGSYELPFFPPFIESVFISFGSRRANLPGLLTILPKSTLSLSRPLLLPFWSAGYKLIHSVVKSLQLPQAQVHTLPLSYPR